MTLVFRTECCAAAYCNGTCLIRVRLGASIKPDYIGRQDVGSDVSIPSRYCPPFANTLSGMVPISEGWYSLGLAGVLLEWASHVGCAVWYVVAAVCGVPRCKALGDATDNTE